MVVGSNGDVFTTCVSALNCVFFYLSGRKLLTFFSSGWSCAYHVAGRGLDFFRGAVDWQLFKATEAAQEVATAALVLWQWIAVFGLSYGVVKFFTYFGQTDLLKRGVGTTYR